MGAKKAECILREVANSIVYLALKTGGENASTKTGCRGGQTRDRLIYRAIESSYSRSRWLTAAGPDRSHQFTGRTSSFFDRRSWPDERCISRAYASNNLLTGRAKATRHRLNDTRIYMRSRYPEHANR